MRDAYSGHFMTDKPNMDWYLKTHTELVGRELVQAIPRIHNLLVDREPWEKWLRDSNKDTWGTYQRLRSRANELWVEGSENPDKQAQFILAIETEYQLARWAIVEFLRWQEKREDAQWCSRLKRQA